LKEAIANFAARCGEKLRKQNSCANLVHIFIHTNSFKENEAQYYNSKVIQLPIASNNTPELIGAAYKGLELIFKEGFNYKKAGVMVSGIVPENQLQTNLFYEPINTENERKIMAKMDALNKRMGRDKIKLAAQGFNRKWKLRQEHKSPCYTTNIYEILTINDYFWK
jgi:DNA polymerase V